MFFNFYRFTLFLLIALTLAYGTAGAIFLPDCAAAEERLLVLTGAAGKPPMEELAAAFQKKTGIVVDLSVNGSGVLLSQLKLTGKGDVYFPGSVDFIEKAKRESLIVESTETSIVYLVPSINVQKGNPKNIKTLKDLLKPGVRVVIANPESVCLGIFAVELAENFFDTAERALFRKNIVSYVESCEKTANVITFKAADAVIGWSVFEHWNPGLIETVKLEPANVVRLSYLSAAVTKCARNPETAKKFIEYMKSEEGLAFFKKFHYFTSPEEALKYLGTEKPVGGKEYRVPDEWMMKK